MDFAHQLVQQLINGVSLGSIYALIALGYTMIYGIIKLINFAHGDVYMVGAYIGFAAVTFGDLPILPALLISMALTAVLGMLVAAHFTFDNGNRRVVFFGIHEHVFRHADAAHFPRSHAEHFIQRGGLHHQRTTAPDSEHNDNFDGGADLYRAEDETGQGDARGEFRHGDGAAHGRGLGQSHLHDFLYRLGFGGGGGRLGRRLLQHD